MLSNSGGFRIRTGEWVGGGANQCPPFNMPLGISWNHWKTFWLYVSYRYENINTSVASDRIPVIYNIVPNINVRTP